MQVDANERARLIGVGDLQLVARHEIDVVERVVGDLHARTLAEFVAAYAIDAWTSTCQ